MSNRWSNFSDGELTKIGALLPSLGVEASSQRCPSCGEDRLRWYHYRNPRRTRSKISYVWCGSCRRFYGQTTSQEVWDLPDPFGTSTVEERLKMEADVEAFFGRLDGLWESNVLPQVRDARRRG